jgi:hypothetical protein
MGGVGAAEIPGEVMDRPRRLGQLIGAHRHPERGDDRLNGFRTAGRHRGGSARERVPFPAAVLAAEKLDRTSGASIAREIRWWR